MTDPAVPDACVQAAAEAWRYNLLAPQGKYLVEATCEQRMASALAAALSVRDDQGVPVLLKPWLEQLGWEWPAEEFATYREYSDGTRPAAMTKPYWGPGSKQGVDVAVFRLRGDQ